VVETEVVSFIVWLVAWLVVYGAGLLLLTAASIRVISDSYLGRSPGFGESLSYGVGKIVPLFLVGFGKTLLLGLLLMLSTAVIAVTVAVGRGLGALAALLVLGEVVGAIWLFLYVMSGYMVTTPVVVLESLPSSFEAFGRSWQLTRGAKRRVFWLMFVANLIASALPSLLLSAIGAVVLEVVPSWALGWTIVAAALPVVLTPVIPCVLTLVYYDLRVRREGFDLQLLSEQLGAVGAV
jgi:hypothetical protein